MLTRKGFLKTGGLAAAGWMLGGPPLVLGRQGTYETRRPRPAERRFTSAAVEVLIERIKDDIADPQLAWLFENCFPNTLDTTVEFSTREGKPDTFVITGDIEAMWLRDSSAQVWPYLPLARQDPALRELLEGVIRRQTYCIHIDPYANAFNREPGESPWADDLTEMQPMLHERKWEVDSLCYPIRLAYGYWKTTGDTAPFDAEWKGAMERVLETFTTQQRKEGRGPYRFQRVTGWQTDTVPGGGWGNPIRPAGLIVSIFRPSDDATTFPFLVPSNLFAVVSLKQLAEMAMSILNDPGMAARSQRLAQEVERAARRWALLDHLHFGTIWAYEVDGFGNRLHMDDANVPSLLSLPYLGWCAKDDPAYLRTRDFVLSRSDPWFFQGQAAEGVGGPHVGRDMVWPMSIIMRALTSTREDEIRRCLDTLKTTHAGTGLMHESFHKDDPSRFTRAWFAWANTLFGELIVTLHRDRPRLLKG